MQLTLYIWGIPLSPYIIYQGVLEEKLGFIDYGNSEIVAFKDFNRGDRERFNRPDKQGAEFFDDANRVGWNIFTCLIILPFNMNDNKRAIYCIPPMIAVPPLTPISSQTKNERSLIATSIASLLAVIVGVASLSGFIGREDRSCKPSRSTFQASSYRRAVSFGL